LPTTRWREYRKLRLEALRKDATAFSSSYEEERNLPESEWKKRTKNTLIALSGGMPIGMITYIFNNKRKL